MEVNIPIGKIIQEEVFQKNVSLYELSERLKIHKKTLLLLFNCKTMDLNLLYRWCCLLKIDFFTIYSKMLTSIEESIEMETMRLNSNKSNLKITKNEYKL